MNLPTHIILFVITWAISVFWGGFVFKTMWEWFVVPTFGLPSLTVFTATGLIYVVTFITTTFEEPKKDRDPSDVWVNSIVNAILKPAICLSLAWVVYLFT